MSEAADKPSPKCPMCAGTAELKQVLRHENERHYFFRCLVCTVVFPIIELISPRQGGVTVQLRRSDSDCG